MRPLSCLLLIPAVTGTLGDAGVVAAAMVLAQGVASPALGRLADRVGQRRVLLTACAAHAVAIAVLLVAILLDAPLWLLVTAAAATGCASVSFTSFVRARWTALVDHGLLRTAFALESVLDETIFLLGPLLVTALSAAVHPAAGLVACAVLTTTGSVALALHRRSEPAPAPTAERPPRAIGVPGVRVLMVSYAGMGFLLGAVDVTMVAFAREWSVPALGGVFLSLTAVGSLVAGAIFGAVDATLPPDRLLWVTTGVLALGAIPLAFAGSPLVMGFLAVVAGIAIAPALITGSTLLESLAPRGSLSEGFSWLTSAGALGIASGTAVGGQLADAGFQRSAWVAVGGGVLALAVGVAGRAALRPRQPDTTATAQCRTAQ
ncbi:MFS transporter [Saccharothrix variisporea]|nr:MFS transporter [Saccharothrix variisporea]